MSVWGSGFTVQGSWFMVQGLGSGFRVQGLGLEVWGSEFRAFGPTCRTCRVFLGLRGWGKPQRRGRGKPQ